MTTRGERSRDNKVPGRSVVRRSGVRRLNAMSLMYRLVTLAALTIGTIGWGQEPETRWSWMSKVQERTHSPVVKYCGDELPSMKAALEVEHQRYRSLVRQAVQSLEEEYRAVLPEFSQPPEPGLGPILDDVLEVLVLRPSVR